MIQLDPKKTSLPGIPSIFAQNFSPHLRSNPLEKFQHPLQPKEYTPKSNPPRHLSHTTSTPFCFVTTILSGFFWNSPIFVAPKRKKSPQRIWRDPTAKFNSLTQRVHPRDSDGFWLVVGPYKNTRHSPPGDDVPSRFFSSFGCSWSRFVRHRLGEFMTFSSGGCPKNRVKNVIYLAKLGWIGYDSHVFSCRKVGNWATNFKKVKLDHFPQEWK